VLGLDVGACLDVVSDRSSALLGESDRRTGSGGRTGETDKAVTEAEGCAL
jgi:hypothetical protein